MSAFSPTPSELALVTQIFAQSDPQKLGVLTGDVAVNVFGGAKLPPTVLGEVWNLADEDNKGWLSKRGVSIAVRLIGWAQKGEKVTAAMINKPGPLAHIEGVSVASHSTGSSLPQSPLPGVPQLTAADKAKYDNLFQRSQPVNGLLSAEKARDVFLKSKLNTDQLLQVWNLADTKDRGALDSTDFAIGMYLIQNIMSGKLPFIPTSLPPGLYQQASGAVASQMTGVVASHNTGNSGSFSPLQSTFSATRSPMRPQYTGQQQPLQPDHTGMSNQGRQPPRLPSRPNPPTNAFGASPFGSSLNGNVPWDITSEEKTQADTWFDNLDTQRKGFVDGDIAVPFMLQSGLPGDDLAHIWDLTDMNGDGRLTKDCFAVAMHLIQKKLAGQPIPQTLPQTLIPPSQRRNVPNASPFATPNTSAFQPPPPAPEPVHDLLSDWEETPAPTPAVTQPPPLPQRFTPQLTGSSHPSASPHVTTRSPPPPPPGHSPFGKNFLDDEEETAHAPLPDHSVELGNVRNQLDSTTRSLETTKAERATLEQTSANQAAELESMQSQLAVTKASYDHEKNLLQTLRERFATQAADIQKSREELIRAESDLSAVKLEKAELEGSILRDKEEARGLNKKMSETGKEIELLKFEIEKMKKEAKQQKGLLAIAKKQLSTKEAEKAKVEKELEEATAELKDTVTEKEETEAELAKVVAPVPTHLPERAFSTDSISVAAAMPLPVTPDPSSPSGSKSNNPFERLAMGSGSRSQSPFLPFANAALPTPPVANGVEHTEPAEANLDDPFGLEQPFAAAPSKPVVEEKQEALAPPAPAALLEQPLPSAEPLPSAAETDLFQTPPTTASPLPSSPSPPPAADPIVVPRSTTIDEVTAKFPAVDNSVPGAFPSSPPAPSKRESTDLNHQLKDIEVDESDSDDSDSDDDEVPLGQLKRKSVAVELGTTAEQAAPTTTLQVDPPTTNGTNGHASADAGSFDDVFGLSPDPKPTQSSPVVTNPSNTVFPPSDNFSAFKPEAQAPSVDPFGSSTTTTPSAPVQAPPVSGVDAFDAAMSGIVAAPSSSAPQFSFDDTFDFAAATVTAQPTAATVNANGHASNGFDDAFGFPGPSTKAVAPAEPTTKPSFDDVFATGPESQSSAPSSTNPSTLNTQNHGSAFADNFAFSSTPSLSLDNSFTAQPPAAPGPSEVPAKSPPTSPKAFPSVSAPTSPERPQTSSTITTSPPSRQKSPPPRVASPKPRPSTSSSKEGYEKPKDPPPTRHSKLSIRLPFGKKKKQQHEAPPPPPPAQFLTPPIEEQRSTTPAVADDAPPVKQLCGMGFSRTQAIEALEAHGYDVNRALNSLLESQ